MTNLGIFVIINLHNLVDGSCFSYNENQQQKRRSAMKESRRKFFVSELNRILPLVKETMSMFGEYYLICEEYESKAKELEKVRKSIEHNKKLANDDEEIADDLGLVKGTKKLKSREKMLADMLPMYKQEINIIHDEIKFRENYFAHQVAIWPDSFLKAEDINDEYLMELAYMMSGKIGNGSDAFFDDEITKQNFYTRLDAMYPQAIDFTLQVDYTREKFFEIFSK